MLKTKQCSDEEIKQKGNIAMERFNVEADLLIASYMQFLAILMGGLRR